MQSLSEPEAFLDDWYGWLTNQAAHIGVGVFLVFCLCVTYWSAYGEMPDKTAVYLTILSGYVAFEIVIQGWRSFDTIEDSVFVVGYGAAAVLAGFTEVVPGSPVVAVDVLALAPFFIVAFVHLVAGSIFRVMRNA